MMLGSIGLNLCLYFLFEDIEIEFIVCLWKLFL